MFFVIALVSAVVGFGGLAMEAAWIGKVLFVSFMVLFVVSTLLGKPRRRPIV
jgi:uncharacterized membrane protein YtjA (UPF0391 family)